MNFDSQNSSWEKFTAFLHLLLLFGFSKFILGEIYCLSPSLASFRFLKIHPGRNLLPFSISYFFLVSQNSSAITFLSVLFSGFVHNIFILLHVLLCVQAGVYRSPELVLSV
jgi:hypothetical protein